MTNIAVNGSLGRMGQRILALAKAAPDLKVSGEFDQKPPLTADALKSTDALIDFSSPDGVRLALDCAVKARKALVIGTTGLTPELEKAIAEAAKTIPIVRSGNMSVGVNVVLRLLETAAKKLGKDFAITMTEAHHVHKKDAPSGTAKMMEQAVRAAGRQLKEPIKSVREGEIVGDHTALFTGPAETIEITHRAQSRDVFALGALEAARFASKAKPGKLYSMSDVLGI